jgi:5-methylcytosine-specific restriction endonuclease McrA
MDKDNKENMQVKVKKCTLCSNDFFRNTKLSYKQFDLVKFCSKKCRGISQSLARMGKPAWNKGGTSWSKGKHLSEKHKENMRISNLGKKRGEETKKRMSLAKRGVKRPNNSGEKCWLWKGGITPKNTTIRMSLGYRMWRESVFKRDKWTCQDCFQVGGKLNADHIKPFCLYPELRLELSNGRTLCEECHRKTGTFGGRSNSIYSRQLQLKQ